MSEKRLKCHPARSSSLASPIAAQSKPPAMAASTPAWASSTTRQFCRGEADHFSCFQEYFRTRFGMRDTVAVRNGIEEVPETNLFQNERRVFAGRADGQFQIRFPQRFQSDFYIIGQIGRRHIAQQFPVQRVLFFSKSRFFFIRIGLIAFSRMMFRLAARLTPRSRLFLSLSKGIFSRSARAFQAR